MCSHVVVVSDVFSFSQLLLLLTYTVGEGSCEGSGKCSSLRLDGEGRKERKEAEGLGLHYCFER